MSMLADTMDTVTAPFRMLARGIGIFMRRRARSRRRTPRVPTAQQALQRAKIIRFLAIGSLACVVLGIIGFFALAVYFSKDLPQPGQIVRRDGFSTRLYDRNGKLLFDLYGNERRTPVAFEQIPATLREATVATEDKDFYKHGGFDILTLVRIPYNLLLRQRVVGGSTLTQQLVKTVLLSNDRTLIGGPIRKFKELILAIQIERKFTKDQILTMYLNEVPYGGNAAGVGAASEIYFNKSVSDLNLVESAILAGLPQRPSAYSPFLGRTDTDGTLLWQERTQGVLRRMHEDGYIDDTQYQEALDQLPNVTFAQNNLSIQAPHFVFYVKDILNQMYGESVVDGAGLKVTTSLDLDLQNDAQQTVKDEVTALKDVHITNGAAMAMDPQTGEILAMVGSADYFDNDLGGQFNVAVDGLRQPGSSIKPVTYLALLQKGYTPASMLVDAPTVFTTGDETTLKPYEPKNYDGQFHGPVNVRTALGSSLNIPAVKALSIDGVDTFMQLAYTMGFPTLEPTKENMQRVGLSATLGGAEVHLIDTVSAYSAFANGGYKVEPVAILKIEDKDGKVIYEHKPVQGQRVMSEGDAYLIDNILSDNNARLLAFGPNSLLNTGKAIAVKTGTTNDQKDNWTIGWSQNIMVGTWVGNNDSTPMKRVASGITGASPIWRKVILDALSKGYTAPEWKMPDSVEQVTVDAISGYPAHDGYPERTDVALKGTMPTGPDPIHAKLKICRADSSKLANDAQIAVGDYDEREYIVLKENDPISRDGRNRWMEGIQQWINGQDDSRYKYPTEKCDQNGDVSVRLSQPENEKKYDSTDIKVEVEAGSGDGIQKLEIIVDGNVRETINDYKYSGTIKIDAGQHEVWAKAYTPSGKTGESGKVKIGTGGQDWKKPEPTATPTPSPTPTPTIVPSLTPSPSPAH